MDVKDVLRKGLQSTPKYLPVWYRYDKEGSIYNDKCLEEGSYYLYPAELSVLKAEVEDMIKQVPEPRVLVEMGGGNSEKSRIFIDTILKYQPTLEYTPVDISKEFLEETCEAVARDYGEKLIVRPIAGDYSVGIEKLRNIAGNKLIIWLGGGNQNEAYASQVSRLAHLSTTMSENDKLITSLDINQNAQEVEKAYIDSKGISASLYLNAIRRLCREYGCTIDINKLELEVGFVKNTEPIILPAKSRTGLEMSLEMEEGEYLNLFEGEGVSCKYTLEQIRTLVETGNLRLSKVWTDQTQHVALCCISK